MPRQLLPVILLCGLISPAPAAPRDFAIDPVHSRIVFSVDHAGFSKALGTLSAPRGWIRIDRDEWTDAAVEAELDLSRVDLGDADWNRRIAKSDFFDLARHPVARFRSTSIEPIDQQHAQIHGELELRGVRVPVELDVVRGRDARHPLTMRRTIGFSATATIRRSAFGMTTWPRLVGDTVELRIEVEGQRKQRPQTTEHSK